MPRIRTIKPDFWKDEDINALPEATQLLAIALLNYADDEGYFNANEMLIKSECCPLREPSVSISSSLNELSNMNYINLGECNGKRYGKIVNFEKHQRVSHKKDSEIKDLEIAWEDSVKTCGRRAEDVRNDTGSLSEDVALKGRERKGIEENTNPISKAVPSKKEEPHDKIVIPPVQDKNKNGVSKDFKNISQNFKSYDQKIKIVASYLKSLTVEERYKFRRSAINLRPDHVPAPEPGSMDEGILLIELYDKRIERKQEALS